MKRRGCLSYLFSSNLLALCLSRLRIQISRDAPDNDTAPPAAKLEATATSGGGEAGEKKTKGLLVFHFDSNCLQYPSTLCVVVLVLPRQVGFSAVQLPWTSQVTSLSPSKVKSWSHVKEHSELNVGSRFEQLMWPFSGASSNGHVTAVGERQRERD